MVEQVRLFTQSFKDLKKEETLRELVDGKASVIEAISVKDADLEGVTEKLRRKAGELGASHVFSLRYANAGYGNHQIIIAYGDAYRKSVDATPKAIIA